MKHLKQGNRNNLFHITLIGSVLTLYVGFLPTRRMTDFKAIGFSVKKKRESAQSIFASVGDPSTMK